MYIFSSSEISQLYQGKEEVKRLMEAYLIDLSKKTEDIQYRGAIL